MKIQMYDDSIAEIAITCLKPEYFQEGKLMKWAADINCPLLISNNLSILLVCTLSTSVLKVSLTVCSYSGKRD
jgi:hypothetical protein